MLKKILEIFFNFKFFSKFFKIAKKKSKITQIQKMLLKRGLGICFYTNWYIFDIISHSIWLVKYLIFGLKNAIFEQVPHPENHFLNFFSQ